MIDKEQENKIEVKPDPNSLLLAEVEVREADPKAPHRKQTGGEVAFNRIVYTGIGLGVNEGSALVIADEFQHGVGKKLFDNISKWMVKNMHYKDTFKHGVHVPAQKNAANMLLYASLLISGTALVWPMKALEDNKGTIVKKANHAIDRFRGNHLTPEEVKARDDEVEKGIACESKQTWPSLIMGRLIAIGSVLGLGAVVGHDRTQKLMGWSEKTLTGSIQPTNKNRAHRYAALVSLETITCTTAAVVLELASKLIAKRGVVVRNPELCTAIVHEKNGTTASGSSGSSDKPEDKDTKECTPEAAPTNGNLEKYKKKPVLATEKHTDLAKSGDAALSLAP